MFGEPLFILRGNFIVFFFHGIESFLKERYSPFYRNDTNDQKNKQRYLASNLNKDRRTTSFPRYSILILFKLSVRFLGHCDSCILLQALFPQKCGKYFNSST